MKPKQFVWLALGIIAFAVAVIIFFRTGRPDPHEVIFRRLDGLIQRSQILYAKQVDFGREPSFIGIVAIENSEQTAMFKQLGCTKATTLEKREQVGRAIYRWFENESRLPSSNALSSAEVWAGSLQRGPFYISALVSGTNAFVILDRY